MTSVIKPHSVVPTFDTGNATLHGPKMPDRIWAQPGGDALYIDPDKGRYSTAQTGTEYLALHGETLAEVRAAVARQVENIDRWRETGIAAGPYESREIYEGLRAALAKMGGADA